jgi:hypothetical protein
MIERYFYNLMRSILSLSFAIFLFSGCTFFETDDSSLKSQIEDLQQQNIALQKELSLLKNISPSPSISSLPQNTEIPSTNAVSTESPTANKAVQNEEQYGYITKAYEKNGKQYIDIDYIQKFIGYEALVASIEDGKCKIEDLPSQEERKFIEDLIAKNISIDEKNKIIEERYREGYRDVALCFPNGMGYDRNQSSKIRTLSLMNTVSITMATLSHKTNGEYNWGQKIDFNTFSSLFNGIEKNEYLKELDKTESGHVSIYSSYIRNIPFWVEIQNGEVQSITEQYVP